jgi:transcriptional regulator with XRE-family HTH domain
VAGGAGNLAPASLAGGAHLAASAGGAAGAGGPKRTLLRPPPWDKGADADSSASFGAWLRRQREARQISLREIADRTKISLRYLEAMEEDRFEVLPAPVFAKGFLREYARYVGLSPDEVVNHYLSVQQPDGLGAAGVLGPGGGGGPRPHAWSEGDEARERRGGLVGHGPRTSHATPRASASGSWPRALIVTAMVVALLGIVAFLAFLSDRWRQSRARRGEDRPPIVAPVAAPVPAGPPVPAAAPSAPLEVTVDFSQECWVEVIVDGGSRRAEMREQGESMQLDARQSVVFTKIGNAAAVEIQVNGYPYPLEKRKQGEVVPDLKIDLDTVRALKAKKEGR